VAVTIWVLVIAAGIGLIRIGYYDRLRVTLGLIALTGLWYLFHPLYAGAVARHVVFPAGLVILLWVGQLVFWSLPRSLKTGRTEFLKEEARRKSEETAEPEPESGISEDQKEDEQ
jgi:hypothetical protein